MDTPMPEEIDTSPNGAEARPAHVGDANHLDSYRDALRVLSTRLLRTDWPKQLKAEPYVIASVAYILRDIIRSLEHQRDQPGEQPGQQFEEILQELNTALRALYVAETLATPADTERIELFYANINSARNSLYKAGQLIPAGSR